MIKYLTDIPADIRSNPEIIKGIASYLQAEVTWQYTSTVLISLFFVSIFIGAITLLIIAIKD